MKNIAGHEMFPSFTLFAQPGDDGMTTVSIRSFLDLTESDIRLTGTNMCPELRLVLNDLHFLKRDISGFDWGGITLKDCSFTNCFTKRRQNSWNGAEFDNVAFKGKFLGNLVVNVTMSSTFDPENLWPKRTFLFHENVEMALDLSDVQFDRFPTFRGIPVEKIRRGPGMFVANYAAFSNGGSSALPSSFVANSLKSSRQSRVSETELFVVPLLAKDAAKHLEDCMELVELGLLSE